MVDVSGIPNMGFGGGGYFGGSASMGLPAMSADQINQGIWGNYSPQQAQIPLQNNFDSFGQQTDYYSGLGAQYGRNTGGFGGGMGSVFDQGAAPYNTYGQPDAGYSSLSPAQQSYYDAVTQQYGYAPSLDFFKPGGTWEQYYGAAAAASPSPSPINQYNNGGYDPYSAQTYQPAAQQNVGGQGGGSNGLTPEQQSYYDAVTQQYGYAPSLDFFKPGGTWEQYYGSAAAASPSPSPINQYNNGGYDPYSAQTYQPAAQGNVGGLSDAQQSYYDAVTRQYGYAPSLDFFKPGGTWDQYYGGGSQQQAPAQPDFSSRFNAAPANDPNSFANRFGAGGYYQPGTPSQYYTGDQYGGGGGLPPGFSGTYGVDSPNGALPLDIWGSSGGYQPGG